MARFTANRTLTVHGKEYERGDHVPVEKLDPTLRRKLIEHRRVVEDKVNVRTRTRRKG